MTFRVGDRVAHPMHGAGVIDQIETQKRGSEELQYYVLRLPVGDMRVLIPVDSCDAIGVRPIIASEEAEHILNAIPELEISMTQNWNRRYRENMLRIKSGDLTEVAVVVKSLIHRGRGHTLSTGERKMLAAAKRILLSELSLVLGDSVDELERRLDGAP